MEELKNAVNETENYVEKEGFTEEMPGVTLLTYMLRKKRLEVLRYRRRPKYDQTRCLSYLLIETYKNAKHLTGKQVAELFSRYRVWEYVYSFFEALRTTGTNYIVKDIDLYIEARKPAVEFNQKSKKVTV